MQVALGREEEPLCLDVGTSDGALAAGYAHPDAHREANEAAGCRQRAVRTVGHRYVAHGVEIGSLHVNAPGWEGWVLQGFQVGALPAGVLWGAACAARGRLPDCQTGRDSLRAACLPSSSPAHAFKEPQQA